MQNGPGRALGVLKHVKPRSDIARQRLYNQRISESEFTQPGEVVSWLGAIQSQDYAGAKWAVAQRAKGLADAAIDRAFARGTILRTHVMRPTWHFVAPEDIRWLLALTAPRVHAANAYQYRRLELNRAAFTRSDTLLWEALRGGGQRTRAELGSALQGGGIDTSGLRLVYLLMNAELEGVICSGARRGKQFTYALLDERVPRARSLNRDEALAELTLRYFLSRGPGTENDFMWWSGLARVDVQSGIEMVKHRLVHDVVHGKTYWYGAHAPLAGSPSQVAYLLPNYDEYVVGYTDRSIIFDPSHAEKLDARNNPLFQNTIVVDGQIAGTWKRTRKKDRVVIDAALFTPLSRTEGRAAVSAARRYGEFLELPAEVICLKVE